MASYVEEFERQIVPKYRNYYVSYTQLLDAIDLLKDRQQDTDSAGGILKGLILPKDFTFGDTTAMYGMLEQRPEVRFVSLLQHEVSKLNHFTQLEVRTMLSILRQIDKKLDRIASGDEEESISRRVFPSMVDEADACLSLEEKVNLLRSKLRDQADEVLVLEDYITINISTLARLTRQFDSRFQDRPPVSPWFLSNLVDETFSKVPFNGLFSILATLSRKCGLLDPTRLTRKTSGPLGVFSIPRAHSLRVKLILAEEALLETGLGDFAVPSRPEDLPFIKLGQIFHEISAAPFKSVQWSPPATRVNQLVLASGEARANVSIHDELLPLFADNPVTAARVCVYEETRFDGAVMRDHVRIQSFDELDLVSYFQHPPVLSENVSISSILYIDESSAFFSEISMYIGDVLGTDFDLGTLIPETWTLGPTPNRTLRHSASTFSIPGISSPRAASAPMAAPKPIIPPASSMIYPKNFMANERSALAWISATAVQAGVGVAFLGKPGLSLVGALICLVSMWFLWWSILVFVRRFRQLKLKQVENEQLFYNMDMPTAFGFAQLIIIAIQTICMLFY